MIKPVYFGNKEKREIEYVNNLNNFSEWVKEKIREEIGIDNSYHSKVMGIDDNKNIEDMIRKVIGEMNINTDSGKDILTSEEEIKIDSDEVDLGEDIDVNMWSL